MFHFMAQYSYVIAGNVFVFLKTVIVVGQLSKFNTNGNSNHSCLDVMCTAL